jgi:hypothetical protein
LLVVRLGKDGLALAKAAAKAFIAQEASTPSEVETTTGDSFCKTDF